MLRPSYIFSWPKVAVVPHNHKERSRDFKDISDELFTLAASYVPPCAGAGVDDRASRSAVALSAGLLYRPSKSKAGFSLREKAGEASSCMSHSCLSQPSCPALATHSEDKHMALLANSMTSAALDVAR